MSSPLTCTKLTLLTLAAVILQIIGLSLFVFGFFPVKPALSGDSGVESYHVPTCNLVRNESERDLPPEQLRSLYQELSGVPPSFDQLILMVIDGLPAEFVLGKDDKPPSMALKDAMPYTQSLLANGVAIGYHAKAAPPTVTMPRLKAMVSGAIGGFLDVAFNFNSQAFLDDNLLGQFFKIGWKMVMHGDETWLKLFPGLFVRHDGVSSFFVKDTVHVDNNVSRHLEYELSRDDWSLLILHYLGLDHVGHIGGRYSVLMAPKLTEMDEVVKMIHMNTIVNQDNERRTLLMVVSDHGMTDNGNHGGSSYEETDSLVLLIGLRSHVASCGLSTPNKIHQVDIGPTLALLSGVPIPKNNVGIMISGTIDSLTDSQGLRALQLNSWQLFRLLQAHLTGMPCGHSPCDACDDQGSIMYNCDGNIKKFCSLFLKAATLHSSWILKEGSRSGSREDYCGIVAAYYDFLRTASEWLSHRATDKPVKLLAFGVSAMLLSCLTFLGIIYHMFKEIYHGDEHLFHLSNGVHAWHLDDTFAFGVILILVISMGSSSMVEEEQYIWHFLTSTLFLLSLRKSMQSVPAGNNKWGFFSSSKRRNKVNCLKIYPIFVLLVSGRILRAWHQGGVNWTYLPDISKWLEQAGSDLVRLIQFVSGVLMISLSLYALFLSRRRKLVLLIGFSFLMPGSFVLHHIVEYQNNMFVSPSHDATLSAQIIYALLGIATSGTVVSVPWIISMWVSKTSSSDNNLENSFSVEIQNRFSLVEVKDSLYLIGWAYIASWCLLQLLLQKQINSMPTLLLLIQILAILFYCSDWGSHQKQWVQVASLYYLGMAGHFALGNSNSLATIDVAAAFIGISNYSTILSGILMFIITYASPMLFLLSMVMYISVKDNIYISSTWKVNSGQLLKMFLGFPCLVPLGVNSILLAAYTMILLLMRNHLFVWSVFSPKYLYVCATTICVYTGVFIVAATVIYAYAVLALRKKMRDSLISADTE